MLSSSVNIQNSLHYELNRYKRLLKGVAAATNRLLTTLDYQQSVDDALAVLGTATEVDRIYIFETHLHPEKAEPAMSQRWEWTSADVTPEIDNPELQNLLYSESLPRWYEELSHQRPIAGLVENFPDEERAILEPQGILSILVVPIFIRDCLWGFVGFDQCHIAHEWSELELETLRAIAGSLGGAIAQHQAETKLQELNQRLEETIDQRTCALRQTNAELAETLSALKVAQTQLIHAEKMTGLGQLVAGIAHEINNPATFIYSNLTPTQNYFNDLTNLVNLYQSEYPKSTPRIEEELEEINLDFVKTDFEKAIASMAQGVRRINKIIQSLRDFSKHDEAEYKCTNIHTGIESALNLLQHRINPRDRQRAIAIEKHYESTLPNIMCCGSALNQVFLSIFNNAIDALEEKTALEQQKRPNKIEIVTETLNKDNICIRITDNANGIAPKVQSRIFDPFFTNKPVGQGTGLGLSIAYQIVVQQHKGKLTCQSEVGKGTCILIELPKDLQLHSGSLSSGSLGSGSLGSTAQPSVQPD